MKEIIYKTILSTSVIVLCNLYNTHCEILEEVGDKTDIVWLHGSTSLRLCPQSSCKTCTMFICRTFCLPWNASIYHWPKGNSWFNASPFLIVKCQIIPTYWLSKAFFLKLVWTFLRVMAQPMLWQGLFLEFVIISVPWTRAHSQLPRYFSRKSCCSHK